MDKVSDIVKTTNLEELVFHIDYVEMILEIMEKRGLQDPNLESEHRQLLSRYYELSTSN